MPLNLPFTAGRAEDPKLYELLRSIGQQALKSQDFAAVAPIILTRGTPGTPLTFSLDPTKITGILAWPFVSSITAATGITLTPNPITSAGTVGLTIPVVPSSGGTGTTTTFTQGSVVFAGASGVYSQNNANFFWDNATPGLKLGGGTRQMAPSFLTVRGSAGSQIEFGHSNAAGYGSSLGATVTNGLPFITFACEAGTTAETFRTRGIKGNIIEANTSGDLIFGQATTANADNQALTERMRLLSTGLFGINIAAPTSRLHVDGGTTAGTVASGTATWTNGSASVTGSGFSASWAGSQIAETTTASTPGFLILSATATTITLSTPYSGTTGSKGYTVLLRNNTQTLSGFTADHANGLYAYVGTGQNDTYGIFIDANADTTDTGAAINVSNFGNADAIHIGLENRASGTPRATGIGIDMNRCLYPSYASTGINIANFSGYGGATDNGYWSNVVLTGQVGGAGSMIDMQADGPIIVVSPASSAWVAGAEVIRLWSQPSHAGSIVYSLKGSGVYSSAGQFRSSATDASAQTIATGTMSALTFTTNTTDVGSIHSTSTNTSRFTVPASNVGGDGWYLAAGQVEFASNTTGIRLIDVYKNGTTRLAYHDNVPCTGGNASALQVTWQGTLAAGDYIEFRCFQDSGGNLNTVAGAGHTFGTISKMF